VGLSHFGGELSQRSSITETGIKTSSSLRDVLRRKNYYESKEGHRQIESRSNTSDEPLNCISPITTTQQPKPLVDLKPFDKYNAEYHKSCDNKEYHNKFNVLPAGIRIEHAKSESNRQRKTIFYA
jgi:hypothetical protein